MHDKQIMLELTKELLNTVEEAEKEYDKRRIAMDKGDFFQEVKPFADRAHKLSNEWKDLVIPFLQANHQKNLHANQIKATVENIELLTVQCFFPETSYNRFKSYVQSSFFVLEQVENVMHK
ncbi:DUF1798 family protein [Jeotgalibacillus soli]|uniref:DUF1798 family protein n=1 Tax=Jeotgalibacillus soli TaxID=889306 RepID=A0A0C2RQY6_9BACL|nr:DUF1798 family protein [Jeotgalibacillus soli]KIL44164.1 hypothetical protein KP78_31280 [Jeotgalibacillus soli]